MTDQTWFIVALVIYFAAMIAIGVYGALKTKSHEDYMLGGRNLPPAVAALSAGASDMSGWLVMGLPGALYATGLVEIWLAIGLTIGAYLNWKLVAPRLRAYTEIAKNSITVPSFLSNRTRDNTNILRIAAGIIILVFFTLYVSSGMVAGGKFFVSSFGGDYTVGMLIIAGVTLLYTLFGGFLGASYTDVVQGLLMFAALLIVPVSRDRVDRRPRRGRRGHPHGRGRQPRLVRRRPPQRDRASASSPRSPGASATSASPTSSCASWRCARRTMRRSPAASAWAG